MSYSKSDELRSKVTKESLEDIAAKEAVRLNRSLLHQLVIPAALLALAFVLPSSTWWLILLPVVAFAVYFQRELQRLEVLRGRGARASRRPMRLSPTPTRF